MLERHYFGRDVEVGVIVEQCKVMGIGKSGDQEIGHADGTVPTHPRTCSAFSATQGAIHKPRDATPFQLIPQVLPIRARAVHSRQYLRTRCPQPRVVQRETTLPGTPLPSDH